MSTSGPIPWPNRETGETWHLEKDPDSEARIWLSSQGKILWHPPEQNDTITFEERTLPNEGDNLEQRILDFETLEDANWKRFYHGLIEDQDLNPEDPKKPFWSVGTAGEERGIMDSPEDDVPMEDEGGLEYHQETCVAHRVEPHAMASIREGDKYFVSPWESIQEEMIMEEESRTAPTDPNVVTDITSDDATRLEGDGAVPVSPQEIERMTTEERKKWIDAMIEELESLKRREVYEEVTNQDLQRRYWSQGKRTKMVPGRLLTVKNHYMTVKVDGNQRHGWCAVEILNLDP